MSFLNSHFSLFLFIARMAESSGAPFHWCHIKKEISLPKNWQKARKIFEIKLCLSLFIILISSFQLFTSTQKLTVFDKRLCGTLVAGFGCAWFLTALLYIKRFQIIAYLNGHIRLNKILSKSTKSTKKYHTKSFQNFLKSSLMHKFTVMYAYSLTPFTEATPYLLFYIILWTNPCKPLVAGYWLIPQCFNANGNIFWNVILKVFLLSLNQYSYSFLMKNLPFVTVNINVFCITCYPFYIEIFQENCRIDKTPIGLYRVIQVLASTMNDIMK